MSLSDVNRTVVERPAQAGPGRSTDRHWCFRESVFTCGAASPPRGRRWGLGADPPAVGVNPPPTFASAAIAAQAAEIYWMALLRDVPFAEYDTHPLVAQAAADLSSFSGYTGPKQGGQVTPQTRTG